jgi:hypothetical protein
VIIERGGRREKKRGKRGGGEERPEKREERKTTPENHRISLFFCLKLFLSLIAALYRFHSSTLSAFKCKKDRSTEETECVPKPDENSVT